MRLLLVLLLLAGCATVSQPRDEAAFVSGLVETALDAMKAPPEKQRAQLAAAQGAYAGQPDDPNRLRVAVLLATLPTPLRDESRALALLDPLAARQPATPLTRFASLLGVQIRERQGAVQDGENAWRRQEDLLRAGEQREEALQRRLESMRNAEQRDAALVRRQAESLRASEQREETLRRQIDGLRASERGMIEREDKLGTRTR